MRNLVWSIVMKIAVLMTLAILYTVFAANTVEGMWEYIGPDMRALVILGFVAVGLIFITLFLGLTEMAIDKLHEIHTDELMDACYNHQHSEKIDEQE